MIIRGNDKKEVYPELQKDYRAYVVKCTIGRDNGSCFLAYDGYTKGTYSNTNITKVFGCFAKTLMELPITVSLSLENKITNVDETYSIFLAAVEAMNHQRESILSALSLHKKRFK